MNYVYILKGVKSKYYIGSTSDLKRRMKQHLSGHTYSTRRLLGLSLVFSQEFETLEIARKVELRLKKLKRKDYIDKIIKEGYIKLTPP